MNVDRSHCRFSVPVATVLVTLWLVVLVVHSTQAHPPASHIGAVRSASLPQAAPLPLANQAPSQATPAVVVPVSRLIPSWVADTAAGKGSRGSAPGQWPAIVATFLTMFAMALFVWRRVRSRRPTCGLRHGAVALFLAAQLAGCGTSASSQPTQSSTAYLQGALNWIEAHSVFQDRVNWKVVRHTAATMTHGARTTAAAYGGIIYALKQTRDGNGFLLSPSELAHAVDPGMRATYADRMVVDVQPNGPAARAGVRVGDVIESINGSPPTSFEGLQDMRIPNSARLTLVVRRTGVAAPTTIAFSGVPQSSGSQCTSGPFGHVVRAGRAITGYINLSFSCQTEYTSEGQNLLRAQDRRGSCGWIIDVRQTTGGDIWNYLAAIGPIIGDGALGGFLYPSGRREPWTYRHGAVLWNGHVRDESQVQGSDYVAKHPMPPIAVLTSHVTNAAGELFAIALRGRPQTRIIGERTHGFPNLQLNTPLSDGAMLLVSGAISYDRTGQTFKGPVTPDVHAKTQWTSFGRESDPPVQTALRWLKGTPQCSGM